MGTTERKKQWKEPGLKRPGPRLVGKQTMRQAGSCTSSTLAEINRNRPGTYQPGKLGLIKENELPSIQYIHAHREVPAECVDWNHPKHNRL